MKQAPLATGWWRLCCAVPAAVRAEALRSSDSSPLLELAKLLSLKISPSFEEAWGGLVSTMTGTAKSKRASLPPLWPSTPEGTQAQVSQHK